MVEDTARTWPAQGVVIHASSFSRYNSIVTWLIGHGWTPKHTRAD